jgi:hypothetical protein
LKEARKGTKANGNANIHLFPRDARTAWNWLRVCRYALIFTGKRLFRLPALFFATTSIERDWVTVRSSKAYPNSVTMLKITTVKTNRQCRIVVEGELITSGVNELKREWDEALVSAGCLTLVVDLRNVITIGQEGKEVLLGMMGEGARFICGGVHNRHVLQQLARKIHL